MIPRLSRIRPVVHYDPFRRGALHESLSLGDMDIRDLSCLQIRYPIPGGSRKHRRSCEYAFRCVESSLTCLNLVTMDIELEENVTFDASHHHEKRPGRCSHISVRCDADV